MIPYPTSIFFRRVRLDFAIRSSQREATNGITPVVPPRQRRAPPP
jgi:hypothetical protein